MGSAGGSSTVNVTLGLNAELDYFTNSRIASSAKRLPVEIIAPLTALQPGAPIEFLVPASGNLVRRLDESSLHVKVRIVKADGTDLAADSNVGPINCTLHSLFRNIDVELNGKLITDPNELYPYRAYIETLFDATDRWAFNRGREIGWAKDTPGKMDVCNALTGDNIGLKTRANTFKLSKTIELYGRPHLDIFHQPRAIPTQVAIKLRLIPSSAPFALMAMGADADAAVPEYKFVIDDIKFHVASEEPLDATQVAIEQMAMRETFKFPMPCITLKTLAIPANIQTIEFPNVYNGQIPERLVFFIVEDGALVGNYKKNPFHFKHHHINNLVIYLNGETIPGRPLRPDFTNGLYGECYYLLLNMLKRQHCPDVIELPWEDYNKGYTIFGFDLTADHTGGSGSVAHPGGGELTLSIQFGQAVAETLKVICVAENSSLLEIDHFRTVSITPL
jgi:hypothetical protein